MNLERNKIQLKEIFKFLVGGGSAVLIDYSIYQLLLSGFQTVLYAKGISYLCGAAAGFMINKLWTFQSRRFSGAEVLRYIILYLFSACINAAVNKIVLAAVSVQAASFLCATGVSTVLNFLGQKFFVFVKDSR